MTCMLSKKKKILFSSYAYLTGQFYVLTTLVDFCLQANIIINFSIPKKERSNKFFAKRNKKPKEKNESFEIVTSAMSVTDDRFTYELTHNCRRHQLSVTLNESTSLNFTSNDL